MHVVMFKMQLGMPGKKRLLFIYNDSVLNIANYFLNCIFGFSLIKLRGSAYRSAIARPYLYTRA